MSQFVLEPIVQVEESFEAAYNRLIHSATFDESLAVAIERRFAPAAKVDGGVFHARCNAGVPGSQATGKRTTYAWGREVTSSEWTGAFGSLATTQVVKNGALLTVEYAMDRDGKWRHIPDRAEKVCGRVVIETSDGLIPFDPTSPGRLFACPTGRGPDVLRPFADFARDKWAEAKSERKWNNNGKDPLAA